MHAQVKVSVKELVKLQLQCENMTVKKQSSLQKAVTNMDANEQNHDEQVNAELLV